MVGGGSREAMSSVPSALATVEDCTSVSPVAVCMSHTHMDHAEAYKDLTCLSPTATAMLPSEASLTSCSSSACACSTRDTFSLSLIRM